MTAPNPEVPRDPKVAIEQRFPALNDHLIRMASTGQVGSLSEWGDFFNCLRAALAAAPAALQPSPDGVREKVVDQLSKQLAYSIANLCYPVGMGIAPPQDECVKAAQGIIDVYGSALAALPPVSGGRLGETVAWRYRRKGLPGARWSICEGEPRIRDTHEVQPLYARQQAAPGRKRGE